MIPLLPASPSFRKPKIRMPGDQRNRLRTEKEIAEESQNVKVPLLGAFVLNPTTSNLDFVSVNFTDSHDVNSTTLVSDFPIKDVSYPKDMIALGSSIFFSGPNYLPDPISNTYISKVVTFDILSRDLGEAPPVVMNSIESPFLFASVGTLLFAVPLFLHRNRESEFKVFDTRSNIPAPSWVPISCPVLPPHPADKYRILANVSSSRSLLLSYGDCCNFAFDVTGHQFGGWKCSKHLFPFNDEAYFRDGVFFGFSKDRHKAHFISAYRLIDEGKDDFKFVEVALFRMNLDEVPCNSSYYNYMLYPASKDLVFVIYALVVEPFDPPEIQKHSIMVLAFKLDNTRKTFIEEDERGFRSRTATLVGHKFFDIPGALERWLFI